MPKSVSSEAKIREARTRCFLPKDQLRGSVSGTTAWVSSYNDGTREGDCARSGRRTIGVVGGLRDEDGLAVAGQLHVLGVGGLEDLEVAQTLVVAVALEGVRRGEGGVLLIGLFGHGGGRGRRHVWLAGVEGCTGGKQDEGEHGRRRRARF